MARSGPDAAAWDVVVNSCSVRTKRGGELTGPNPTDRGKSGTRYHVVVSTDGLPLAVVPSPANVHDIKLFPDLLRLAQVACTGIGRLYADAGYDSADNRWLCLRDGIQPQIRKMKTVPYRVWLIIAALFDEQPSRSPQMGSLTRIRGRPSHQHPTEPYLMMRRLLSWPAICMKMD
ncbi:transposase [Azospirillum thiophilum]|uniref:transposase n=1 Tax=Azospirillum thiophilum TaxID=528244 RepID=UPI001910DEF7